MPDNQHWAEVYRTKAPDAVSWYQPRPEPTLRALERLHVRETTSLIDIGGGASTLVDNLIECGWSDVTVLDIAAPALEIAKARLGQVAERVHWEVADITTWNPGRTFDVWHDRAVFHFLTAEEQRQAYRQALRRGLAPDGLVIMATFALDGPERCSGLPVQRYDAASLTEAVGPMLKLADDWREVHITPAGTSQAFTWCAFRRA